MEQDLTGMVQEQVEERGTAKMLLSYDWSKYNHNRLEVVVMPKKGFDWKIWGKKSGIYLLYAVVTGFVCIWQEDPKFVVIMPLLLSLQNFIKHKWM